MSEQAMHAANRAELDQKLAIWIIGTLIIVAIGSIAHGWRKARGRNTDHDMGGIIAMAAMWPGILPLGVMFGIAYLAHRGLSGIGSAAARLPAIDRRARIQAEMRRLDAELKELGEGDQFEEFDDRLRRSAKSALRH